MKKRGMALAFAVLASLGAACAVQASAVWTEYSPDPVFHDSSPANKAYYPTILENNGTYTMWYSTGTHIDMATSTNGIQWTYLGEADAGILATASHPLVEKIGNQYQMWYWDGVGEYAISHIHTATSTDGVTWSGDTPLTQVSSNGVGTVVTGNGSGTPAWNYGTYGACDVIYNANGSSAITTPVSAATVWANKYVMYYDGTTGGAESVGIAVSNDGVNWEGYNDGAAAVFSGDGAAWDTKYATFCTVIQDGAGYEMYYSGGSTGDTFGIGYATSTDGIVWTGDSLDNPIFSVVDGNTWRTSRTYTPQVIGDQMWFSGVGSSGYAIGYATSPAPVPEPLSMIFFGTGLVAVGGFAARRKMQRKA